MITSADINQITQASNDFLSHESEHVFLKRVVEEHNLMEQYRGREIFELLQNIDDAAERSDSSDTSDFTGASFKIVDGWLEVANSGKPFTLETLKRLCEGRVSIKDESSEPYIGYKGIGFRSVLNLADVVEIHSGHGDDTISVRFSREYAESQLDKIKTISRVAEQIKQTRRKGYDPLYPMLKAPEPIGRRNIGPYDTMIRLKLRDESVMSKVKQEMADFKGETMLFLSNITRITFDDGEDKRILTRIADGGNVVTISDSAGSDASFYLSASQKHIKSNKTGSELLRMAVAIPVDTTGAKANWPLYSFFPILRVRCPFPAILHATFCLTDNRNDLDLNSDSSLEVNAEVWRELLNFYVEQVCRNVAPHDRLWMLMPINFPTTSRDNGNFKFADSLGQLAAEAYYRGICGAAKVLCNVNGVCVSPSDSPLLFDSVPHVFRGEAFDDVVAVDDAQLLNFARYITDDGSDDEAQLLEKINAASDGWSPLERAEVFKWWDDQEFDTLPRLLRTRGGEFVTDSDRPIFLSGGQSDVPKWAKIDILDKEDEEALLATYSAEIQSKRHAQEDKGRRPDEPKRILPSLISDGLINLQEQSSSASLISPVNESVGVDHSHAVEFMQWLHRVHDNMKSGFGGVVKELTFNLPTAEGVGKSNRLYLDAKYGFGLCGDLMRYVPGYQPLMYDEEVSGDIDFLMNVGVLRLPPMIEFTPEKAYVDYLLQKHPIDENIQAIICKAMSVVGLDDILSKASEAEIVRWLLADDRLTAPREKNGWLRYQPSDGRRSKVMHLNGENMPAYLRYRFSHARWIDIDGKKVAPADLLIADEAYPIDHIDGAWLRRIEAEAQCDRQDLRALLLRLGAKESVTGLSSDRFYELMLSLPGMEDKELSKRLSRRIYREVIDNGAKTGSDKLTAFYADSSNKKRFLKDGEVVAEDSQGRQSYCPVAEVRFSSAAVYRTPGLLLIKVPPRSGNKQDFFDIFGVKEYAQSSEVTTWNVSSVDSDFQKDFKQLLPCVMAYRQNRRGEAAKLEIKFVDSVVVKLNGEGHTEVKTDFDPYSLLRRSNRQWLIYVGTSSDYGNLNRLEVAMALEQIFYVFLDHPSQDFLTRVRTLFLCDPASRELMVKADLGSLDELKAAKAELGDDEEMRKNILATIGSDCPPEAETLVNDINWLNSDNEDEQAKIARLMQLSGKSVAELTSAAGTTVSIAKYNSGLVSRAWKKAWDNYRRMLHGWLTMQPDLRENFDEYCNRFVEPKLDANQTQNADLDAEAIVGQSLSRLCDNLKIPSTVNPTDDDVIKATYERNHAFALSRLTSGEIIDMLNDAKAHSLMFFDDSEAIAALVEKWHSDGQADEAAGVDQSANDEYLQNFLDNVIPTAELKPGKLPKQNNADGPMNVSGVSPNKVNKDNKHNSAQGSLAEYLVVRRLADTHWADVESYVGKDYSVKWVSSAAGSFVPQTSDPKKYSKEYFKDSLGHDIEVISNDGVRSLYIEVKSSSNAECLFKMSADEFVKSLKSKHPTRVVFVGNLHIDDPSNKPTMTFIDEPIDKAFKRNPTHYDMVYAPKNGEVY